MEWAGPGSRRPPWPRRLGAGALAVAAAFGFAAIVAYSPLAAVAVWAGLALAWQAARRLEWAALGLFLLVPLGRLTWLDATGGLDITKYVVLLLALAWGARCLIRRDRRLMSVWTESPVCVCLLLLFLANLLSLVQAYDLAPAVSSLIRLTALFVMLALVVAMVRSKREFKTALVLLLVSGFIVCLIGLWEALTHKYLWMRMGQQRLVGLGLAAAQGGAVDPEAAGTNPFLSSRLRIMSTFSDFNFMGGYMAVLLGITAGCFLADRRRYLRVALLGMAALVVFDLIRTGSRGGLAAVVTTSLVLLLFSRLRLRWFVLAALLAGVMLFFPVVNEIAPQYRGAISLSGFKQDQRYGYWQMALHMVADHPLTGVGTDNFVAMYPFYRVSPALMSRYYCHNIYLQMWAEAGIPGLLAILAVMGSATLSLLAALRRTRDESWRSLLVGLLAAFLGYAVFSATSNTLHDQPLWLLLALVIIASRATRQEEAAPAREAALHPLPQTA